MKTRKPESHADTLLHDVGLRKTDLQALTTFVLLRRRQTGCGRAHSTRNEVKAAGKRPDPVFRNETSTGWRRSRRKRRTGGWTDRSSGRGRRISIASCASSGPRSGGSVPRVVLLTGTVPLLFRSSIASAGTGSTETRQTAVRSSQAVITFLRPHSSAKTQQTKIAELKKQLYFDVRRSRHKQFTNIGTKGYCTFGCWRDELERKKNHFLSSIWKHFN